MAIRQSMPKQGKNFVARAAIILLAASNAGPVFAAPTTSTLCDDIADLALEVPTTELQANMVSHEVDAKGVAKTDEAIETLSQDHFLAPRVEAALRKVFKDEVTPLADDDKTESGKPPAMKTYVPGISDEELAQYKRQMYRTDI